MTLKRLLFAGTLLALTVFASCKKDSDDPPPAANDSGSLLDSRVDTVWKSPDDSMTVQITIETSKGQKSELYNDTTSVFQANFKYEVLDGTGKPFRVKLTYRHFPQNYSEYEPSTGNSYPVHEEGFSEINCDPPRFPSVQIYNFIPDPGPIDKVEISLMNP